MAPFLIGLTVSPKEPEAIITRAHFVVKMFIYPNDYPDRNNILYELRPLLFATTIVSVITFIQSSKHRALQKAMQSASENFHPCHPEV